MYVIYALIDPRDNTIRYIGITNDVYERFLQHIRGSGSFAKNAWIMELRMANKMVIMETLEEVETRESALERETYWIRHFERLQEPLINVNKRSSPRKAKRTNTRFGRSIVLDFEPLSMESAHVTVPTPPVVADPVIIKPVVDVLSASPVRKMPEIQEALQAYQKGYISSRALAREMGIGKTKASELIQRLKSKNLI